MGKAKFCGEELEAAIKRLPQGKPQMDAYWNAVRQADEAGDPYWRMMFRCRYCYEATFRTIRPRPSRWRRSSAPSLKKTQRHLLSVPRTERLKCT